MVINKRIIYISILGIAGMLFSVGGQEVRENSAASNSTIQNQKTAKDTTTSNASGTARSAGEDQVGTSTKQEKVQDEAEGNKGNLKKDLSPLKWTGIIGTAISFSLFIIFVLIRREEIGIESHWGGLGGGMGGWTLTPAFAFFLMGLLFVSLLITAVLQDVKEGPGTPKSQTVENKGKE